MLVLELTRKTAAPANTAIGAGHIRDGCAGLRGFEAIRLRDHVSDLITAPTVPLNSDRVFVDESLINDGLNSRQHALQRARSRIAGGVDNVRHENQIAVADIERWIDRSARAGIAKSVQSLRQSFVDVDDHRVLLLRIEVLGFQQQTFQRHAISILEAY